MHSQVQHFSRLLAGILILLLSVSVAGQNNYNLDDGVGLHGYDPVSYFSGNPQAGDASINTLHEGITWYFVNATNRDRFVENPEDFLPEYGGWCAYAMLEGDKVDIDPESYKIVNGKLYVFYDGFWGDTLKRWNRMLEEQPESALITTADQHWQQLGGQ